MRKCPQCGQRRARFSHRNLAEKALGLLLLRPYRCNVCMRRFWWWTLNARQIGRHQRLIVAAVVVAASVGGSYLYLRTLPYESELPRPAGVRAPKAPPPSPVAEEVLEVDPGAPPSMVDDPRGGEAEGGEAEASGPSLPPAPPFEVSALRDSGRLLDIISDSDDDELHLLLQTDAPPRTFQYFRLQAPERLVIDIQGGWRTDLPSALVLDHALTRGLRIGQHEDMVRVVIELVNGKIEPPEVVVRGDGLALVLRRIGSP